LDNRRRRRGRRGRRGRRIRGRSRRRMKLIRIGRIVCRFINGISNSHGGLGIILGLRGWHICWLVNSWLGIEKTICVEDETTVIGDGDNRQTIEECLVESQNLVPSLRVDKAVCYTRMTQKNTRKRAKPTDRAFN